MGNIIYGLVLALMLYCGAMVCVALFNKVFTGEYDGVGWTEEKERIWGGK